MASQDLAFLGLDLLPGAVHGSARVRPQLLTPVGRIYGGACLALAVAAMGRSTGRTPLWVSAQFIGNAVNPDRVTLEVAHQAAGRKATQAQVHVHHGDNLLFTGFGVLRDASLEESYPTVQWATMPASISDPPGSPAWHHREHDDRDLSATCWGAIELRTAAPPETLGPGRLALWGRVSGQICHAPTMVAYLADVVPLTLNRLIDGGGPSLDNTIRFAGTSATEWVLLDVALEGAGHGFGYGTVRCWAEDGTLLAVASQTVRSKSLRSRP